MNKFIINGGVPLKGSVSLCGAKNSGFKLMIAALYGDSSSTIHNFSKIGDVYSTAEIIKELGGEVEFGDNHVLKVSGEKLKKQDFSETTGKLSRASTYFIGPLLHRFGETIIPNPGGCKIGRRPLDRHLDGIKALGAIVTPFNGHYRISASKLKGTKFKFHKITHGGTDIMIIAACIAEGKTVLENVALEPEVDDLILFLNKMGAKIIRTENRTIEIEGVKELAGTDHQVMYDRNEAVTFACAALATKGDVFVEHANFSNLNSFLTAIESIGGGYENKENGIRFFYKNELKAIDITTRPYPGFMTDWMSLWGVLMTQANGVSNIHETIFENRFAFTNELVKMGANIKLFNPEVGNKEELYNFNIEDDKPENFHAAEIIGPTKLHGSNLEICDIRAGASIILASLIADGTSELSCIEHVDRGYENLDGRLRMLGANIQRTE